MKTNSKPQVIFVTYHINDFHSNYIPVAVKCDTRSQAIDIYNDSDSLFGLSRVNINMTNSVRKDAVIITPEQHYKYKFNEITKEYLSKMFVSKTCVVRPDLLKRDLSVPVGNGYYDSAEPIEYRYKNEGKNNEQFQVFLNNKWQNAESIDFEF